MKDFKSFILRGNAIDLAVGVVMGAAFGAVVNSLVRDILTPLLGIFGTPDFGALSFRAGKATVTYGVFLNTVIALFMTGFGIFFFVMRPLNKLMEARKTEPDVESVTKDCPQCLSSIPAAAIRCAFCTAPVAIG